MQEKIDDQIVRLDEQFWTNKYTHQEVGWDIGYVSTPLKTYFDQIQNTQLKILIPGAGNAYEAEYLWQNGFKNVYVADISETPLASFSKRLPDFPKEQLLHQDFFQLEAQFDLIVEQTFFCALNPILRQAYVEKMQKLLSSDGKLVGLLFNAPLFTDRPPFGGNKDDYAKLFNPFFKIELMEEAYNSIVPRSGKELFIKLRPLKT